MTFLIFPKGILLTARYRLAKQGLSEANYFVKAI